MRLTSFRFNFSALEKHKEYGPLFLRLLLGSFLWWGTQDNVFSYAHMLEFKAFLQARGTPFPLAAAFLSAYAQFICGLLYIIGAFTRHAAAVMIINFVAAILIAHVGDSFRGMFPALVMLFGSCFFLLHGPGRLAVDEVLKRRGWRV
jgi:putative oxidoreductase